MLGKVWFGQIFVVIFINKVVCEMKDCIGCFLGEMVEGMLWLGIFYSVSVKIFCCYVELVGEGVLYLKFSFIILDIDDQIWLLKQLIVVENIDEKCWFVW